MQAGDCFHGDITGGRNKHYWVVLCDPHQGGVALVNFTTGCGGPKSQKISKTFFNTLDHDSEVNWIDSVVMDDADVCGLVASGLCEKHVALPLKKLEVLLMIARSQGLVPGELDDFLKQK